MDESSGNASDSSGNSLTLTNNSTMAYGAGKFGNSVTCDGTADYLNTATAINGVKTVSLWVYPASAANNYFLNLINSSTYITINSSGVVSATGFTSPSIYVNGVLNGTVATTAWSQITITSDTAVNANAFAVGLTNDGSNHFCTNTSKIDEVRVYNRTLSPAEISQLYNWAPGPVGYWKMDEGSGNPNDSTGNGNNGSWSGTGAHWITGKYGKGGSFNGTDDGITITNSNLNLPTYTFSAWVQLSPGAGTTNTIATRIGGSSTGGSNILILTNSGDGYYFSFDTGTTTINSIPNYISTNRWYFITVVKNQSDSSTKLYFEGKLMGSTGLGNNDNGTNTMLLGVNGSGSNRLKGGIDNVSIYNYARTPKQIIEDMNAGHPAGGSPISSMQDYWKLDEGWGYYATSSGITASTGSISPSISVPPSIGLSGWQQAGKFGKALAFNGTNNYINFGDLSYAKNVGTMSASFWVRPNALATTTCLLCKWNNTAGANSRGWGIETDSSTATAIKLEFSTDGNTGIASAVTAAGILANNVWSHITMVYDSSMVTNANILKLYVNGVQKTLTFTGTIPNLIQNNTIVTRAGSSSDGARFFSGIFDEIKLYSGALDRQNILIDYNRGSSIQLGSTGTASQSASMEYCIPGDTTSCNPPVGEWKFEEGTGSTIYDLSGSGYNGSATGTSFKTGKNGKGVFFNGSSGDKILFSGITWTPTAFSVNWWLNPTSCANYTQVLSGVNSWGTFVFHTDSNCSAYVGTDLTNRFTPSDIPNNTIIANQWQNLAYSYDGTYGRFYKNGRLIAGPKAQNNSSAWGGFAIGDSNPTYSIFGSVDEVKIYNYARSAAQIAWDYNRGAPVAHWKMDECQGTTINDSSGNGNVGTWSGSGGGHATAGTCVTSATTAWYNGRTGKYNGSLDFDGGDDVVNAGSNSVLDDLGPYSLSFWMKPDTSAQGYIISKRDSCAGPWRVSVGGGTIYWFKTTTSGDVSFDASNAYSDSTWSHVVITWDGTVNSSGVKVYVNGILKSKTAETNGTAPLLTDATCSVRIGDRSNNTEPFEGQIDDVKIFNYVLTATQIKTEYNQSSTVRFGPATGSP
jgi:hypothetical protein